MRQPITVIRNGKRTEIEPPQRRAHIWPPKLDEDHIEREWKKVREGK